MRSLLNFLSLYFETVPRKVRKFRYLLWLFFIVMTVVMSVGISRTHFDMTMDGWFEDDDPAKIALNQFRNQFGSDEGIFIVYKPKDGDLFSTASLSAVKGIRDDLLNYRLNLSEGETSTLGSIKRVDTIVNASYLVATDDALVSKKLIGDTFPQTEKDKAKLKETALRQKGFPLIYFSRNFEYGGISIQTDLGTTLLSEMSDNTTESDGSIDEGLGEDDFLLEDDDESFTMEVDETLSTGEIKYKPVDTLEYVSLWEDIEAILEKPEYAGQLEYLPAGNPPLYSLFYEMMSEMGPLFTGMIAIIFVLLWFSFRSPSAILWPICIVALSSIWVVGLVGWLGMTVSSMLTLTIVLIMAVGVAASIHIMSGYTLYRSQDFSHEESLDKSFHKSALPCMLTSITTMVGMLSLTFTSMTEIRQFGFSSALGVVLAFLFTIFLLPLMLDLWPPATKGKEPGGDKKEIWILKLLKVIPRFLGRITSAIGRYIPNFASLLQRLLDKILPLVERRPFLIISLFLALFIVCVYGTTQVRIDTNLVDTTKEGSRLRQIYEVVDKYMAGTQNMEIMVDMGAENALQDPIVLKSISELQQTIERLYPEKVIRTHSLADVVKDAYQVLNEGKESMYIIPSDPAVLAQTLFLFNNASPEDRRRLVSDDYSKSHISIQLHNAGSYEYTQFFTEIKKEIEETFGATSDMYPDQDINITGGLAMMMVLVDYISWAQIRSLLIAISIISLFLVFVFGSIRMGLMSIIPNLLPSALTFGLLGLFGLSMDGDTIIIAPIIIGIAVDDTIHFITHYRNEVIIHKDIHKALKNTLREVGQAITFTSLILGFGFMIMIFSSYTSLIKVGGFGSLAIFTALLCDLLLLPALILVFKPMFLTTEEKKALRAATTN